MIKFFFLYLITVYPFFCICADPLPRSGFFTEGGLHYWQAEEGGLSYAIESSSELLLKGQVKRPSFEWDFAFDVGLGYRVPHDTWEVLLAFTSFQTHTDAEVEADSGNSLLPVWLMHGDQSGSFAEEAKMHWRLHLGLLELDLSKVWQVTDTLRVTPLIGIQMGSVRQKFNLEYLGGSFTRVGDALVRMKNKYLGLGPKVGLLGSYEFSRHFALFGKGAVSLLYGEFYIHQDEDALEGEEKWLGIHEVYRAPAVILDIEAGLRFHRMYAKTLKGLSLELSLDQLVLFSQNQLMHFTDQSALGVFTGNQGDLSIFGGRLAARFDF
jgi:hypothetical protein